MIWRPGVDRLAVRCATRNGTHDGLDALLRGPRRDPGVARVTFAEG